MLWVTDTSRRCESSVLLKNYVKQIIVGLQELQRNPDRKELSRNEKNQIPAETSENKVMRNKYYNNMFLA